MVGQAGIPSSGRHAQLFLGGDSKDSIIYIDIYIYYIVDPVIDIIDEC